MSFKPSSDCHPSMTERRTLKMRQVATGLVIERQPPDAHGMVASGEYEYVPADTPSIRDQLLALSIAELAEYAPYLRGLHQPPDRVKLVDSLVPRFERGELEL